MLSRSTHKKRPAGRRRPRGLTDETEIKGKYVARGKLTFQHNAPFRGSNASLFGALRRFNDNNQKFAIKRWQAIQGS